MCLIYLLISTRDNEGLVNKERELAGLQLEEKNREAQLWRKKYLQLQVIPRSTIARYLRTTIHLIHRHLHIHHPFVLHSTPLETLRENAAKDKCSCAPRRTLSLSGVHPILSTTRLNVAL